MSWILSRNRKLRHTLTLLCAMCLAGAATWASHRWIERRDVPHRIENRVNTKYLHKLLGLPLSVLGMPNFEVQPGDFEDQPHYAVLCRRVAQRARLYMRDPSAHYDVWMVGMYPCRGFPFISQDWTARVEIYEDSKHYQFTAGQDGNPPILYGGLIGNWLFYLAVSAAMLYAVQKAVITIIIRRRRRRHGFPVVMINEEEA